MLDVLTVTGEYLLTALSDDKANNYVHMLTYVSAHTYSRFISVCMYVCMYICI